MSQRELAARILTRPTEKSSAQLIAAALTDLTTPTDEGKIVLVVDDAHTLSDQAMELLLVITSPARGGRISPQLILAGRGAFWDRPWRDELRVVMDVAEKIILSPLTAEDARDFVMAEAERSRGTVTDVTSDALTALVRWSSGMDAKMGRIVTDAVALANRQRLPALTKDIVEEVVLPDPVLQTLLAGDSKISVAGETVAEPATLPPASGPKAGSEQAADVAAPRAPVQAPVNGPATNTQFRGGWPAVAAVVLVIAAGATIGLVPELRTEVASLFDQTAPVTAPPAGTAGEAATDTMPSERSGESHAAADLAADRTAPATPEVEPPTANPLPTGSSARPGASLPPAEASTSEPSAAPEPAHPAATNTASGGLPVAPVPQPATPPVPPAGITSQVSRGGNGLAPPASRTETPSAAQAGTNGTVRAEAAGGPAAPTPATLSPVTPPAAKESAGVERAQSEQGQPASQTAIGQPAAGRTATNQAAAGGQPGGGGSAVPSATVPSPTGASPAGPSPTAAPPLAAPPVVTTDSRASGSGMPATEKNPVSSVAPATATLPPAAIAVLLDLGNQKLQLGDILSARLYFERAGSAGNEEGEMGAAKTYDPGYLATIDAPGLQGDVKRALDWYRIAATTHGNREAQKRIDALTAAGAR